MEIKLINSRWVAVINDKLETYNELPPVHKKLFEILLNCEMILCKYRLSNYNSKPSKINLFKKIKNLISGKYENI